MKQLVYLYLGLFLVGGFSSLKAYFAMHDRLQEMREQIVLHLKEFDGIREELTQAILIDQVKVVDKDTLLAYFTKTRALAQKLFTSEKCSVLPTLQEDPLADLTIAFKKAVTTWLSKPEEVPTNTRLELITRYVEALSDLFWYSKMYDIHQTQEECIQSFSRLIHHYVNYLGVTATLVVCLLPYKEHEAIILRMHLLDMILTLLSQALLDTSLPVDNKQGVFEYLTKARKTIEEILSLEERSGEYLPVEPLCPLAHAAALAITKEWEHTSSNLFSQRSILREVVHQNTQFFLWPEGVAFTEALLLLRESIEKSATSTKKEK